MNILESVFLGLESIAINKFRSALTMLGVIIGVTSVILLVSIGEGAKNYITEKFSEMGTNVLIIFPGKTETHGMEGWGETVRKLTVEDAVAIKRRCPWVSDVAPIVVGSAPVKCGNRYRDVPVIGTTNELQHIRNLKVEIGSFIPTLEQTTEKYICVLGRTVKWELFGRENALGKKVKIGGQNFRVIGIMQRKGTSLGWDLDDLVFIPVKTGQQLFNTDGLTEMLASVVSAEKIERAEEEVAAILKKRHAQNEDFTVINQTAMLSVFETILDALTYALAGIAGISLLVGGIGIMNIMLVAVGERTREIGIRKAVGAKRRHIMFQFLVESATLSSVGGTAGILIGFGASSLAKAIEPGIPSLITPWSVVVASAFSFLVGIFFGVYPARRAARLNPIDALRYE